MPITRTLLSIILLQLCYISSSFSQALLCDDAEAPELVRIYYVNGMNNIAEERAESVRALARLVGLNNGRYAYGQSVNTKEAWFNQFSEVLAQRQDEPQKTLEWSLDPTAAPQVVQNQWASIFADNVSNSSYSNDGELRTMVNEYLQDLRSGKKVVLVSHSQGNFYANNAYQYIAQNFPQYRNSIGIVAVGTPASRVQDGGFHSTNSLDRVINTVRKFYPVLPANFTYDEPRDAKNHNFINTYIAAAGTRIRNNIQSTIARLQQPKVEQQCNNNQAVAETLGASKVTTSSALLRGRLKKGKNADAWFAYGSQPQQVVCKAGAHDGIGQYNAGRNIISTTQNNLSPNRQYYFRLCALASNKKLSSGAIRSLITKRLVLECNSDYTANGGSNGLFVTFQFGSAKGIVRTNFEAFQIPDAMTIFEHNSNRVVLKTPGFVTGVHNGSFNVDFKFNAVDIRIDGNSDTKTKWNIRVNCPKVSFKSRAGAFLDELFNNDAAPELNLTRQTAPPNGTEGGDAVKN